MSQACEAQGLPAPAFESSGDRFTVAFLKDPFTEERLREMGLSDRQIQTVQHLKEQGSIDNAGYRSLTGVSKRTATRDLRALEEQGIVERHGERGAGTRYVLVRAMP